MTLQNGSGGRTRIPLKSRPLDMIWIAFFVVNLFF